MPSSLETSFLLHYFTSLELNSPTSQQKFIFLSGRSNLRFYPWVAESFKLQARQTSFLLSRAQDLCMPRCGGAQEKRRGLSPRDIALFDSQSVPPPWVGRRAQSVEGQPCLFLSHADK